MPRIMAIDYGKKRCGIAVTDPLKLIAGGLTTVATCELMDFVRNYVASNDVERIVIGLPMQTNGKPSENAARVRQFAARLSRQLPDVPQSFFDERYTSVMAHRAMIDGGLGKMRRRDKALVDKISATIILESFLDSQTVAQERFDTQHF